MEENNYVLSIYYLEFINNLDNLFWELLYSSTGYMNLSLKEAVVEADKIIERFDFEANKLKQNVDFEKADLIIDEKRNELIGLVKEHYKKEAIAWANDIYEKTVDNCLLNVTLYKHNPDMADKIYNRALSTAGWISEINKFSNEDKKILFNALNDDFKKAITSKDNDFIPKIKPDKSDPKLFLELRELILKNEEEFISKDFDKFEDSLILEDINCLKKLQNDLKTFKKTSVKDEMLLLNSSINLLKMKTFEEKYNFLKEVDGDIALFLYKNKTIEEKDKVEIIKRRMLLFRDYKNPNEISLYYKELISS